MTLFAGAFNSRKRESRKTDALTSARAALNIISREIANSGYGLSSNGLVTGDSSEKRIHIRANLDNTNATTNSEGEDVTYFFDVTNQSIVRYDPNDSPQTSVVVNRISDVTFAYFDYTGNSSTPVQRTTPTNDTGVVRITVTVRLEDVPGQPANQTVTYRSDVTIRNSDYMLNQY
jgi:flagellar basal body rod protein FlgC